MAEPTPVNTLSTADLIQNENAIGKEMDTIQSDWTAFATQHSGLTALWDKIEGGPDLSPFYDRMNAVQHEIETTQVTAAGRVRLQARFAQLKATIVPNESWKMILWGVGGLIAIKLLSSTATAGFNWAGKRIVRRISRKSKKLKRKRRA